MSRVATAAAAATALPPKVEPCEPGWKHAATSLVASAAPIGMPLAERLRERHDVGRDAALLVGEERPRAAHADLDLVEDQQHAALVAELPGARQVVGARHDHAALAEDRLEQERRRGVGESALERGHVVVGHVAESARQRLEADPHLLLAGRGQGRERPAVEGAEGRDDLVAAAAVGVAPAPRQLDRGLVGLGAAVAEEDLVGERVRAEQLREARLGLAVMEVRDVEELGGLGADGIGDRPRCVAEVGDREAGEEIEVLAAVGVPQAGALAADEGHGRPRVGGHQVAIGTDDDVVVAHDAGERGEYSVQRTRLSTKRVAGSAEPPAGPRRPVGRAP